MEMREIARAVLLAETLEGKLRAPRARGGGADAPLPDTLPVRPPGLAIREGGSVRVPPAVAWPDRAQRVRILHALANHELQAAELFAWAILAFEDAPHALRRGWLGILADEQRHCRMYVARLEALGGQFGDYPVSGHFWRKTKDVTSPLEFVCAMGLTFENANLDFAGDYVDAARACGDDASAEVLLAVHDDEVGHVRFAWEWLQRLKGADESPWEAYCRSVAPPHGPRRARGARFDRASREAAGFDEDFIARLAAVEPERPGGAPRR